MAPFMHFGITEQTALSPYILATTSRFFMKNSTPSPLNSLMSFGRILSV